MMPFWGRVDHFRLAVESVLAQSDPDWRLTIVDDVYPDLSAGEWARSIDDERVTYLRNEVNLRPSRNYNRCIELATEEFLVLMGCDDVMHPDYVERVHELIRLAPDADIIQPGVRTIDGDGVPSRPIADVVKGWYRPRVSGPVALSGEGLARSLLRADWAYFPSLVWRRSRLEGGFRPDLDVVQDLSMLLDITRAGGRMVLDDRVVFSYRRHAGSVSAVTGFDGSKFAQEATLFRESAETFAQMGWPSAARAARWHVSSRLNSLSEVPGALRTRNTEALRALARHALG